MIIEMCYNIKQNFNGGLVMKKSSKIKVCNTFKKVVDIYDINTRLIDNSDFSSRNLKRLVKKSFLCYHEYVNETYIK